MPSPLPNKQLRKAVTLDYWSNSGTFLISEIVWFLDQFRLLGNSEFIVCYLKHVSASETWITFLFEML